MSQTVVDTKTTDMGLYSIVRTKYSDGSEGWEIVPAPGTAGANELSIRAQALAALSTNRTYINRATPTAAQQTAQIKALSQQHNGLIRLLLGLLDGTD